MATELKIHKIPSSIPLRPAVSWLEFLRETHESIETITSICRGKKAVVVFRDDDWSLLSETLDIDAHSANFEPGLRRDIDNALGRVVVIDFGLLTALRRKLHQIERRIRTAVRKAEA
jgi:PHD/YefM family antitoxin component YafN of YafNO toxin-antitoxin module